jgi:hypothetical protein
MKKLLLIALLIAGCDSSTEPQIAGWVCTEIAESESETTGIVSQSIIYNTLEECESVCPVLSVDEGSFSCTGYYN